MLLEHVRWPQLSGLAQRIFVIPLGSLEQHGPHLPIVTDSFIVGQIASRLEQTQSEKIVLLPVQWLGHSPHHRRFGCVSLDFFPYVQMICGICRSLVNMGARKILLLNGHGGNDTPCKAAQRELKSEFELLRDLYIVYAAYWNLAAERFSEIRSSPIGGMGHACEMETSILLAKKPELVDMAQAERGGPSPESGYRHTDMLKPPPFTLINEFDEISHNGVIGMPESASAAKGEQFLSAAVDGVTALLEEMSQWRFQEKS